jgi:circadian clock protein KaiB
MPASRDVPSPHRDDERRLSPDCCDLTLFVSGASEFSARAISNARRLGDVVLAGRYRLAVVNIHEDPGAALDSQVIATPTLIRTSPDPVRRLVGDLSDMAKVRRVLELPVAAPTAPSDV